MPKSSLPLAPVVIAAYNAALIACRYQKNPRTHRKALGARNWFYAKAYKWYGKPLPMLRELALFALNVRNPFEMRLIMKVMQAVNE
jgi:hypothetical protein